MYLVFTSFISSFIVVDLIHSLMAKISKSGRRYDLDWLRVLAIVAVFTMHVFRFFDPMDWEVKNNVTEEALMIFMIFFAQWLMPLFFVISGAAIFYSLSFRTSVQFTRARISRILIPYLIIGIFVLIPPQEYIKLVHTIKVPELVGLSFTEFYPGYITNMKIFHDGFPYIAPPMMHLWFLLYLFIFSLVFLPVFMYLKTDSGNKLIKIITNHLTNPVSILFFSLPFVLYMILLDPHTPEGNPLYWGGWSILVYPLFMFLGFILVSDDRFTQVMERKGKTYLVLAIITFPLMLMAFEIIFSDEGIYGTPLYAGLMFVRSLNTLFFLFAFLGLGSRYLSFTNKTLKYAGEASLPYYMLHQTVIVVIGFYIKDWVMGVPIKFLILYIISAITIMGIYEFFIRRINPVRLLFGLKPLK